MNYENLYEPNCIRTYSGKYVNVFEPTADMICIEDIAHALSQQCRFGGHLPEFYSVAQHSVLCATLIQEASLKLEALMHDASEAYLLDIPSPIKKRLSNYKEIEDGLMKVIAEKFGFTYPLHDEVKNIDAILLHLEWEKLMLKKGTEFPFTVLSIHRSERYFLDTFKELTNEKHLLSATTLDV